MHQMTSELHKSTAPRRLKSPQSLFGTSAHPTMVTLVNIMVMNAWLPSFSFHVNRPSHSWDKAISDSDLEISTPRSRSWVWSNDKVIHSAQHHINSLRFHFTSIRPTISEKELFRNLTLKHPRSRSWVRPNVKVTYCAQYPTDALPFRFTSIGPTIPEIRPNFDLEKTHPKFLKKICKKWFNEWFLLYHADKQIFANRCHSRYLGWRSWKGHPVHFPRPICSLCQITRV